MYVTVSDTKEEMARLAAEAGAAAIRDAIMAHGDACIVLATGTSQMEMLNALLEKDEIEWSRVTAFHLDEYVGIAETHPASFRKYLKERFVERLQIPLKAFHYINVEHNADREIDRLNTAIADENVGVAFVGIGENGHLAFNDPPADFEVDQPYLRVRLDERCRMQQMGEGWFSRLEDVPAEAVSMSIRQIMKSKVIICTVPDSRKAEAVRNALEGPVTPDIPASILQRHSDCHIFLDRASASMLAAYGS